MKQHILTAAITTILLAFPIILGAQESGSPSVSGKPLAAVRFENLNTVSETELNGLMAQYIGKSYSTQLMVEIQSKLYALDYFKQIKPRVNLTPDEEQVIVTIEAEERSTVQEVAVTGNKQLRKGIILDEVLTKEGDLLSRSTVRMDEQNILDVYKERGYLNVSVSSRIEGKDEDGAAKVIFDIQEGNQTVLEEIRFKGNEKLASDGTLKGVMETKEKGFLRAGVFKENLFQDDLRRIEQYYKNNGYSDVEIEEVKRTPREDKENNRINFVITVVLSEGDQYTFGGVEFEGNTLFTDEELRDSYQLELGEPFNKQKFDAGYQSMSDRYYENGYIFNEIRREEQKDVEEDVISYKVDIVEKSRAHIENIIIKGNTKTDEEIIRREIPLEEGDVFNKRKVMEGMRNLYNLQYFSSIEPETHQGSAQGLMDMAFNVEEGKTADILFGISFSGAADFPVSGQIKWTDRNFRGKGQTIGLESNFNPVNQSLALNFRENWLFGRRWQIGGSMKYEHKLSTARQDRMPPFGVADPYESLDYDSSEMSGESMMEYDDHSIGVDLSTGYTKHTSFGRFSGTLGGGSKWNYLTYDDDIYRPLDASIRENLNQGTWGNRMWSKFVYDIRDYTYNPNKGFYFSETLTYAGGILGGDEQYTKHQTRMDFYWPLLDLPVAENWNLKYILKLHTVLSGVEQQFGGELVNAPSQRIDGMFVGRGWELMQTGKALWYHNAEIRMPISEQLLWWDTFLDAAALWDDSSEIADSSYKDYYYSVGTGLRIAYQQFPLALYLTKRFKIDEEGWREEDHFFTEEGGLPSLNLLLTFGIDIF